MKKTYFEPELEHIDIQLTDNVCVSNPEGVGGGGNWGGGPGEGTPGED